MSMMSVCKLLIAAASATDQARVCLCIQIKQQEFSPHLLILISV